MSTQLQKLPMLVREVVLDQVGVVAKRPTSISEELALKMFNRVRRWRFHGSIGFTLVVDGAPTQYDLVKDFELNNHEIFNAGEGLTNWSPASADDLLRPLYTNVNRSGVVIKLLSFVPDQSFVRVGNLYYPLLDFSIDGTVDGEHIFLDTTLPGAGRAVVPVRIILDTTPVEGFLTTTNTQYGWVGGDFILQPLTYWF